MSTQPFIQELDGARLQKQRGRILNYMLRTADWWSTLRDIGAATGEPEASISAQLRHLKKPQYGGWNVEKRRRPGVDPHRGIWEYRVLPPREPEQLELIA